MSILHKTRKQVVVISQGFLVFVHVYIKLALKPNEACTSPTPTALLITSSLLVQDMLGHDGT